MLTGQTSMRPGAPADARVLAMLVDLAGEGIPSYLWGQQAAPGQDPLDVGAARAARDQGGFSYRNAWVAELQGQAAGMLLGYPQPDPYGIGALDELPPVVRPLVELEALSPGSWYVNAVAASASDPVLMSCQRIRQQPIGPVIERAGITPGIDHARQVIAGVADRAAVAGVMLP